MHAAAPEAEETTKWGAPAFTLDGKILLIMAAFKNHAALNFWRGQELRGDEANADAMRQFGKLTSLDDLPPDAELDRLIREAADLAGSAPAPRKTKHAPTPPPAMHPEFAMALASAPARRQHSPVFRRQRSATISNGSPKRSRTQQERSESRPRSNG